MSDLPKPIRDRMAAKVATPHPDADLLTAFAERTLSGAERGQVLAHLAQCPQCRDVVALSMPDVTTPVPGVAQEESSAARRQPWFGLPALRWGTVLAASIVVLAAVLVEYRRELSLGQTELNVPLPATTTKPTAPASVPPIVKEESKSQTRPLAPAGAPAAPARRSRPSETIAPAPSVAPFRALAKPEAAAEPLQKTLADKVGRADAQAGIVREQAATGSVAVSTAKEKAEFARQKAGASIGTATTELAAPRKSSNQAALTRAAVKALWRVAPTGQVEKSEDGGASWEPLTLGEGLVFRAISSIGDEVWVGGMGGTLFHSTDGGLNWQRPRFPSSENIVRILSNKSQHAEITVASGAAWITDDGGASWKRP